MSTLTDARAALSQALTDVGLRVLPEVPETYSPPLCWVAPGSPYRAKGRTIGTKSVRLRVVCIAAQGTNEVALAAVDDLTSEVADAVDQMDGFWLDEEEIDAPVTYPAPQGQPYLGASVNVVAEVAR